MKKYTIQIASVPDRKNLVAEIWGDDELIAEINQENDEMELEIYLKEKKVKFILDEFLEVVQAAKSKLLE
jgi:hypothetical protein